MLVLQDCRPWIIHMGMLRGFGRDGHHFHASRGFEAMPTPLGHDHQHACRQLQGLHDLIDHSICGQWLLSLRETAMGERLTSYTPHAKERHGKGRTTESED